MTDILLISPHQPRTAEILRTATGITQPLGIGYIAAYARQRGLSASILDNDIEQLSEEAFMARVAAAKPLCAGVTVCTSSTNTALRLAALVKRASPGTRVLAGGVQATMLPEVLLGDPNVDYVVIGEGEETAVELAAALKAGRSPAEVRGLALRKAGGGVEFTGERPLIADLDSIPFPAYDLMPMGRYTLPASRRLTSHPAASVVTSRGCPYGCRFCSHNTVFRNRVRFRSPKNVIAEMKKLRADFGVREFLFWDDSILLDRSRAQRLFALMKAELPDILWSASSRVDHMTPELAAAMRAAGCRMVLFGVESGSEAILASINKRTTRPQIKAAVEACRAAGLQTFCSFIIGTPEETEETLAETGRFVAELDPDYAIFCIFAPLPGSHYFREFRERGLLDPAKMDWDDYINLLSSRPPATAAGSLSRERLVQAQKDLFRRFYLRPSYVLKRLLMIRSAEQVMQNVRGGLAVLRLQLNRFKP